MTRASARCRLLAATAALLALLGLGACGDPETGGPAYDTAPRGAGADPDEPAEETEPLPEPGTQPTEDGEVELDQGTGGDAQS